MGRALLILSIAMFFLFGMVQVSEWGRMKIVADRNNAHVEQAQALYIASSVADMVIEDLRINFGNRNNISLQNYLGGAGTVEVYDMDSPIIPASSSVTTLGPYQVLLMARGEYEGAVRNIEVLLSLPAFSKYAYFTNQEVMSGGSKIYFYDDDKISGPTHTNGTFSMMGSPVFNGEVTSANMWIDSGGAGDPIFNKGFEVLTEPIELPGAAQLNMLVDEGINGGHQYDMDITLRFNENGTVSVSKGIGRNATPYETITLSSFNGVISSNQRIHMQGVIDGQVTVHAKEDIVITGDLKYKDDPRSTKSDDVLGIVGEKDVIVDRKAHKADGQKDVNIEATIMALGESFRVDGYNEREDKGTIHLLGGIVQNRRGPVGQTNGNGYAKDYNYDGRLRSIFPPFYPRASRFSIVYWNE